MYPSISQSILQPNILSPSNHSHTSKLKKRIPPFHPSIDDQTGPAQLSKKLKPSKQPSELFADIAENLFSYYSDLGNMKKPSFPFQFQLPQILGDNNLLSQTQSKSQSSSSNFEQASAFSLLLNSKNSSQLNSAQKSARSSGLHQDMMKEEEEAETASKGRSLASSGAFSENAPAKKNSKEVFKIVKQDKYGFVLERKLEFHVQSKNERPLKKSSKSSENKSIPQSEISQKQDELKSRLEGILKQVQSLLDNMKETANQVVQETPKKQTVHVKHEIVSQETQISEREIKIEPKIEEEQTTYQIIPPQPIGIEPSNHEEIKRNPEIRVGEAFQVDINNIFKKKNKQSEAKLIWDPEKFSEEEFTEYQKKIKKILKMDMICEEKASRLLKAMEGNVELALKEIKENSKYYMSHLKVKTRSLRSQNPGMVSQNNFERF